MSYLQLFYAIILIIDVISLFYVLVKPSISFSITSKQFALLYLLNLGFMIPAIGRVFLIW